VDVKYSEWVRKARKDRLEADYNRASVFSREEAEEALARAREFVGVIETTLALSQVE
jgi:uncharacterized protein (UPF0332 family)